MWWSSGSTRLTGGYYQKPEYIQEVTADQDRSYTCNVKYAGVAQTESISIDTFSFALRDRVKIVGTDQTVTCGTTGLSTALTQGMIKWSTQKTQITEDIYGDKYTVETWSSGSAGKGSLTKTVTRDEDQLFTCHIKADNTWWYKTMILDVFNIVDYADQKFVYGRVTSYTDTCNIIGLRQQFAITNTNNRVWKYPKYSASSTTQGTLTYGASTTNNKVSWSSADMKLTLTQVTADYNHDKTYTCIFKIDNEQFQKTYSFDIEESCEVKKTLKTSQTTLTSDGDYSTLSSGDVWVRDTKKVSITCDKGYILDSGKSYSHTCNVPTNSIYTSFTPAGCKAGCWITKPSSQSGDSYTTVANDLAARRSNTLYTYSDDAKTYKLTGSTYTTVHPGAVNSKVIVDCVEPYTRLRAWPRSTHCNSGVSTTQEMSFPGLCVLGCAVTIGTYAGTSTTTAYTMYQPGNMNHDNLLAQTESITYSCTGKSWTATGTKSYTFTCVDGAAAALTECQLVSVVDPTFSTNIGSVRVKLGVPTHPSTAPSQYTVKLYQGNTHIQTSTVSSGHYAAFDGLTNATNYKISYTMTFAGGVHSVDGYYTFTSGQANLLHKVDDHHVMIDVPQTDFTVVSYQLLALYRVDGYGENYDLTEEYYDFKYAGKQYDVSCNSISKREVTFYKETAPTRKCVKIYDGPWYMEQSGDEIAAFIVEYISASKVGSASQYEADVDDLNLSKKNHRMDLFMRACKSSARESCYDGFTSTVVQENHLEQTLLLVILIPLCLIILLVIISFCYKGRCPRVKYSSEKYTTSGSAGASNIYGVGTAGIHSNPVAFEKSAKFELDYNERAVDTVIIPTTSLDVEASVDVHADSASVESVEMKADFSLKMSAEFEVSVQADLEPSSDDGSAQGSSKDGASYTTKI